MSGSCGVLSRRADGGGDLLRPDALVKVFLVRDNIPHGGADEGDYSIAIFSTAEKAKDFILRAKEQLYGDTPIKRYENLEIVEFQLDKEP
jgi:hypothetical protein